jgi:glutathione S-transferase
MKIYGFPLSPFVRKVLVVAQEKGVDAEVVPVNPMQPSDEFREASPYCKIPAIDDGGFKLADSSAIAHYLEAKYPTPALLPAEPQARARAIWFDEVADTVVMAAGGPMVFNRFVKPRFLGGDCDEAAAQAAEEAVIGRLGYLEGTLSEDGWLDREFSLGDIAIASVFRTFGYTGWKLDTGSYPRLAGWYGRVRERPSWKAAAQIEDGIMAAAAAG